MDCIYLENDVDRVELSISELKHYTDYPVVGTCGSVEWYHTLGVRTYKAPKDGSAHSVEMVMHVDIHKAVAFFKKQ